MPRTAKKKRIPISPQSASAILYAHGHTCCVCNEHYIPVQIHHIDENPANNDPDNLAVLCLHCHDRTQVVGGFGRNLNATLVKLHRDKWCERIRACRAVVDQRFVELMCSMKLPPDDDLDMFAQEFEFDKTTLEETQLKYINYLPQALAAFYIAERYNLADGPQQHQTQATIRVADAIERMWLSLVGDYPDDRFPPKACEYISQFRASRGAFHWALARQTEDWPGSMVITMVAWSVLRDMERVIEDTVRALTRFLNYDLESWRLRWERARFDALHRAADPPQQAGTSAIVSKA